MTLDGAAQVAASSPLPEIRMNGLWSLQSAAIADLPMLQPAALWPSLHNVFRLRLTIKFLVASITRY